MISQTQQIRNGFLVLLLCFLLFVPLKKSRANPPQAALQAYSAILAENAAGKNQAVIAGQQNWLFLTAELRHLGVGAFWGEQAAGAARTGVKPEFADPLPAILDFHAQLQELKVQLLLVPVPPKSQIFSEFLPDSEKALQNAAATSVPNSSHAEFYALLRESGIRVLDLTASFGKQRLDQDQPLYCRTDSHWSGKGCVLAAQAIAEVIRENLPPEPSLELESAWTELTIHGDLARLSEAEIASKETLTVRRVGQRQGAVLKTLSPSPTAPVILLGDSHNLIFHAGGDMYAVGAGLPDQLALELRQPVDLAAVRGSGATPARVNLYRRAARDPDYWQGRRWVVWCFAAREFTESDGWRKIPVKAGQPKKSS